jgi:Zn-dependent membrane protease YugP
VEVARTILRANGLEHVNVEMIPGTLSDHYDPREKVLRLSSPVYNGANAAAVGVAAHEAGHALQHAAGYVPITIRNSILPMAQLGSGLAIPMFFIGLIFSHTGMAVLMTVGIVLFAFAVVFHIVTLPVEVNASRRALAMLGESGVFTTEEELDAAKSVLTAAALTYVAGALQAVLTLLYMLSRRR